jgi:hypothetical protein
MATPDSTGSVLLVIAGSLSGLAALAHICVVLGGPGWDRFFGAGEGMARLAADGSWYPALITLAIAMVLASWAAYALSAAGLLPAFPYLKLVLVAVSAVYLLRGVGGFALAAVAPGGNSPAFWLWSSSICLLIGLVHAIGLAKQWGELSIVHP